MTEYSRICPTCERAVVHKAKTMLAAKDASKSAERKGRLCRRCANLGEKNPRYGKTHTVEWRQQQSKRKQGKKRHSDIVRKMRLAAISRIEKKIGQLGPKYNPEACRIIEEYGKMHDYTFHHAENGGEFYIKYLGYWVDGYDMKRNVVVEVDEPRHYVGGKLREKDIQRQKEIEKYLGCEFIRIRL